ncbi:DUF6760 family protein [Winogradskya humida]|uniref:DUF6760 family protein n=1 Tax=Winogradskya humida TaxID=113566 RepID=UPI0034DAE2BE
MPALHRTVRDRPRREPPGGTLTYASGALHAEIAYVAHHLHWSLDTILDLEHPDRRRFHREAAALAANGGS